MASNKTRSKPRKSTKVAKQEAAVAAEPTVVQLELAKAKEIIEPLAKVGKTDEDMLVALIRDGGFKVKKAGRLLQQGLEDMGVRLSAKNRYKQASDLLLEHDFAPEDWEAVAKVVTWLSEELDATTEGQALVAVRKYAKDNGIEIPTKPKGGGGTRGQSGFRSKIHAWMIGNPLGSDADFAKWMKVNEKSQGLINYYTRQLQVARQMAEGIVASK